MPFVSIFPTVYELSLGPINVWLIEGDNGLILVDTGYEHSEQAIITAVQGLGRQPTDIQHIILTHCHPDHAGSLAALKSITKASAWMHPADADVVRGRTPMFRSKQAPGLINAIMYQLFIKNVPGIVPATDVEHEIQDGVLPITEGLMAIHTPGHSAGHMAFLLSRDGNLLFVGDACSNMFGLSYSIVYDDIEEGKQSLNKLTRLEFATVCFGHGRVRKEAAAQAFRARWAR